MSVLADLTSWDDAFNRFTVPEIRQLNADLRTLALSKKTELRDLVGNRYKDMLKTADIIISMNDLVAREDEALSDLITNKNYTSWESHERWFTSFNNSIVPLDTTSSQTQITTSRLAHLQAESIAKLTSATIFFIKRHLNQQDIYGAAAIDDDDQPHNFLLIARSLWLAELLLLTGGNTTNLSSNPIGGAPVTNNNPAISSALRIELDQLKASFNAILTSLLLNGEASDFLPSSSYNSLFLSYAHFHHLTPNAVLETILSSRLSFISKQLDSALKSSTNASLLPDVLNLISTTFSISQKAFAKNSISHLIQKQTDVYSLLDIPELSEDIELKLPKYKAWLPEVIKSERAFPKECVEGLAATTRSVVKTTQYLKSQLQQFSNGAIEIFVKHLPKLIDQIDDLESLALLYRQVLEVTRDNASIRTLASRGHEDSTKNINFYQGIFVPLWTVKFNSVIESSITELLSQENALRTIHSQILRSQSLTLPSTLSTTDHLFSHEFTLQISRNRGYNYATTLFEALDDFSIGSIGDIKSVSHEYKQWLNKISDVKGQIETFGRLKGYLTLSYGLDSTDDTMELFSLAEEDDDDNGLDDFGDAWRNREKANIMDIYEKSSSHIGTTLVSVHDDMIAEVGKLFQKNGDSVQGALLLIRAILLFEHYYDSMPYTLLPSSSFSTREHQPVQELSAKLFSHLASTLAGGVADLDLQPYKSADTGLWADAETRFPDVASLATLKYLSQLIDSLTTQIGNDTLIWNNKDGVEILRREIGTKILGKLEAVHKGVEDGYAEEVSAEAAEAEKKAAEKSEEAPKEEEKPTDQEETKPSDESADEEAEPAPEAKSEEESADTAPVKEEQQDKNESTSDAEEDDTPAQPVIVDPATAHRQAVLQLVADTLYISELFGLNKTASASPAFVQDETEYIDKIRQGIKDQVTKTRVLYLPLSV